MGNLNLDFYLIYIENITAIFSARQVYCRLDGGIIEIMRPETRKREWEGLYLWQMTIF